MKHICYISLVNIRPSVKISNLGLHPSEEITERDKKGVEDRPEPPAPPQAAPTAPSGTGNAGQLRDALLPRARCVSGGAPHLLQTQGYCSIPVWLLLL